MKEIRSFRVLSVGRVFAILGFIMAILQVSLLGIILLANPVFAVEYGIDSSQFTVSAIVMNVVVIVLIYFLVGVFSAFLYNLIARYTGGIGIDLVDAVVKPVKSRVKSKKN